MRALVELHDDVGADGLLDAHVVLGRPAMPGTVHNGAEVHAIGIELERVGEREDLEAAAVGEHGMIPVHETVDTTGLADDVDAGPQVQVVGVGEDDLGVQGLELGVGDALDGGLRAHGHEDRRLDVTMWRMQAAQARSASGVGRYEVEFEHV